MRENELKRKDTGLPPSLGNLKNLKRLVKFIKWTPGGHHLEGVPDEAEVERVLRPILRPEVGLQRKDLQPHRQLFVRGPIR